MENLKSEWNYKEAFSRNLGLVSEEQQNLIAKAHIVIAGVGGVGGDHAVTLARMGFQNFTLADFDVYEVKNFNRQYGATLSNLGKPKVEVIRDAVLEINPLAKIRMLNERITENNIDDFLKDATVYVDGLDAFEIEIRQKVFSRCYDKKIWCVTAGPLGFSVAWLIVDPNGMSLDNYLGIKATDNFITKLSAFFAGLAPAFLHMSYLDRSKINVSKKYGPSNILACKLCAGIVGAEVMKIVTKRGTIHSLPSYQQFDAYKSKYKCGHLWFGRFNLILFIKKKIIYRLIEKNLNK